LPKRVKIGLINDSVNMLDHFVALDLGLYRDEGLEVELVQQPNFRSLTGLDSGEILLTSATPRVVQSILRMHGIRLCLSQGKIRLITLYRGLKFELLPDCVTRPFGAAVPDRETTI